jgi:rhodanese-related sulfurtransferase
MSVSSICPTELAKHREKATPIDLIDVRTPAEFREVHVEFARNVPLDRLDPAHVVGNRVAPATEPLYFVCKSGQRGQQACERLIAAGYTNVVNVEGGTAACERAELPLVRGKRVLSLERQVRIAAGAMVVAGVALGVLVHPGLLGIAAFVGVGLVFAGVTDSCGMAMLLARMPWNR